MPWGEIILKHSRHSLPLSDNSYKNTLVKVIEQMGETINGVRRAKKHHIWGDRANAADWEWRVRGICVISQIATVDGAQPTLTIS